MKKILLAALLLLCTVTASASLPTTRTFDLTTGTIPTVDETAWAYNRSNAVGFSVSATGTTHVASTDNTADTGMHWTGDTFSANHCSEVVYAVMPTTATGTGYGPGVRMDTATTNKIGYRFVASTAGWELFELNNGVGEGSLASAVGVLWVTGDIAKLCAVGSLLTVTRNGALLTSVTDASITTGAPGIFHSSTSGGLATQGIDVWTGSNAGGFKVGPIFFN